MRKMQLSLSPKRSFRNTHTHSLTDYKNMCHWSCSFFSGMVVSLDVIHFTALFAVFLLSPGVASYMCVGPEGYWDPQGPDFSNCTSPWVNLISQKVRYNEQNLFSSKYHHSWFGAVLYLF